MGRKSGQTLAWKWHTTADCNIGTSPPQWTLSTLTVKARVDWRLLMLGASGRSCTCVQPTVRSCRACSLHYRDVFVNSSPQNRMFGSFRCDIAKTLHCHATWSVDKHELTRINTAPSYETAPVCPKKRIRQSLHLAQQMYIWNLGNNICHASRLELPIHHNGKYVMPSRLVNSWRRFGRTRCLHHYYQQMKIWITALLDENSRLPAS